MIYAQFIYQHGAVFIKLSCRGLCNTYASIKTVNLEFLSKTIYGYLPQALYKDHVKKLGFSPPIKSERSKLVGFSELYQRPVLDFNLFALLYLDAYSVLIEELKHFLLR